MSMRSWQARLLEIFLIVQRRLSGTSATLDVARERAEVESLAGLFKPLHAIRCQSAVGSGVPAEWIVPQGLTSSRTLLFLHGGSFNSGSITSHRSFAGSVAFASRARALLIDYRLAPEHPFPAAVEDSVAAYEWLLGQGCAPGQMVVAGGTLALALLIWLRDRNRPLPAGAVCLSPAPDLTFSGESWVFNARKDLMLDERKERQAIEIYLQGADPHAPLASPTFGDLSGLPPLLIQVGSHEVLLSDAIHFAEKARRAGVDVTLDVWPEMQHEWHFAARFLPEGRQAIMQVGAFVEAAVA
jgi:acetyl esterase/lipase